MSWFTIVAVYDDNAQPYTESVDAKNLTEAEAWVHTNVESPVTIIAVFAGDHENIANESVNPYFGEAVPQ